MIVPVAQDGTFREAANLVLEFLSEHVPMGFWSVNRVANDQQTHLYLNGDEFEIAQGDSHAWYDTFCVHMVAGEAPRVAPDVAQVATYADIANKMHMEIGAYVGAPIVDADGSLFGTICGVNSNTRPELAHHEPMMSLLSAMLSMVLAADRLRCTLESNAAVVLTQATTDPLTGVLNRRGWDDLLQSLDDEYPSYADPTVVVIADLDNLKQVNDGPGGHAAGDELLRRAAQEIHSNLRDGDVVARIGGDEFGIVLQDCQIALAPKLVERLSDALGRAGIAMSLGWAPVTFDGLSGRAACLADQDMYRVKRTRRALAEAG
ncbi:GGDEF domain-containing protein [uncultured Jatrophihabitans sp.]|uniref:GGDEF domain-containing protein n=1 Tax=uncultured Jatrophihabitans sp. TaxID=1610747 RepID=UPI0035C98675